MFYGNSYLQNILARESTGLIAPIQAISHFRPIIANWEGAQWVLEIKPSGSYAKSTAVRCSADVDLFISISENLSNNLREIYGSLASYMRRVGYSVRRQNVSI